MLCFSADFECLDYWLGACDERWSKCLHKCLSAMAFQNPLCPDGHGERSSAEIVQIRPWIWKFDKLSTPSMKPEIIHIRHVTVVIVQYEVPSASVVRFCCHC